MAAVELKPESIEQSQTQLTFIGHATVLLQIGGVQLLTDPLLRNRIVHLYRHRSSGRPAPGLNVDAVLISHLHFDHLDLPSLRRLGYSTRLIVPRGAAKLLAKFKQVEELGVGESTTVGPVTITATYAKHDRRRHRFGPVADSLGYLIDGGGHTIYFAGDTDLFPEMATLADQLDVALLPVWGWGPTLGDGHMDPYRAAEALQLLQPRLAIPIHWGTFHPWGIGWLMFQLLTNPPHLFVRYAERLAPDVKTHIISPGGTIAVAELLDHDRDHANNCR